MAEIDLIFCFRVRPPDCCLARHAGWLVGCRSDDKPTCPYCKPEFVDVNFKSYDWEQHLAFVAEHRPKYAVVPDIMVWRDVDLALRRAEQIHSFSTNPIVVPKVDCLHEIPDTYIVGYSIPTKYAGTSVPLDRFAGKRLHLLGGTPRTQWRYWSLVKEQVVSLDGNYITTAADYGQIWNEWLRCDTSWVKYDGGRYVSLASNLMYIAYFWKNVEKQSALATQYKLWGEM